MQRVKVLEFDGYVNGKERDVTGDVEIDGKEFNFVLTTEDGLTSITICDVRGGYALADDAEDLADELGLSGFDDDDVYDEILSAVCEKYSLAED